MEAIIGQLVAGAIGGNAIGKAKESMSLGTVGNTIAGLVGGVGGGQILGMLSGGDAMSLVTALIGGGGGGAILTAVVALVKKQNGLIATYNSSAFGRSNRGARFT